MAPVKHPVRRIVVVMVALALLAPAHALGWGSQGHQAIGEAAQARLSKKAESALAAILVGGGDTKLPPGKLAAISIWPDEIRSLKGPNPPFGWDAGEVAEGKRFNAAHPANAQWHFVNLPLGMAGYPAAPGRFTSPDDVVHALNRCIAILETKQAVKEFSKAQAVRWIAHLVGDIHQPFHVTTGYYRTTPAALKTPALIRDPAEAAKPGVLGDRGGNGLRFPTEDELRLHSLWDSCLVRRVNGEACGKGDGTYTALARKLNEWAKTSAAATYQASGDHRGWAAQWATDTLKVAVVTEAYAVRLTSGRVVDGAVEARIVAPTHQAYAGARIAAAREQLVKATIRLAQLLDAIDYK